MSSTQPGKSISEIEVTNISSHGIWLYAHDKEYFLPYDSFPWFKDKTVREITNVEEASPGHYHWPELDIDLSEKILQNPDEYPLQSKIK